MKDYLWKISVGCIIASLICLLAVFIKVVGNFLKDTVLGLTTLYPV